MLALSVCSVNISTNGKVPHTLEMCWQACVSMCMLLICDMFLLTCIMCLVQHVPASDGDVRAVRDVAKRRSIHSTGPNQQGLHVPEPVEAGPDDERP